MLAQRLYDLPHQRAVLDVRLEPTRDAHGRAKPRPLADTGTSTSACLRFDIAPQPLVGLVPDAEVVDLEAAVRRRSRCSRRTGIRRGSRGKLVIRMAPNSQIRRLPQRLVPVTARSLPATSSPSEREKLGDTVAQCLGKQRVEEGTDLGIGKDIGHTGLAKPLLLHRQERVEQAADLIRRVRDNPSKSARRLEFSAFAPGASCVCAWRWCARARRRSRGLADRQQSAIFGLGACGKARSGFGDAVEVDGRGAGEAARRDRGVPPWIAFTIAAISACVAAPASRQGGCEIAVGMRAAHEAGDAKRADPRDFQRKRENGTAVRRPSTIKPVRAEPGRPSSAPKAGSCAGANRLVVLKACIGGKSLPAWRRRLDERRSSVCLRRCVRLYGFVSK